MGNVLELPQTLLETLAGRPLAPHPLPSHQDYKSMLEPVLKNSQLESQDLASLLQQLPQVLERAKDPTLPKGQRKETNQLFQEVLGLVPQVAKEMDLEELALLALL